jgi:hypothetical protein
MKTRDLQPGHNGVTNPQPTTTKSSVAAVGKKYLRDPAPGPANVQIVRDKDGAALRTFAGGLTHENSWFANRKARRLLPYEGIAQRDFLLRAEVEFSVVSMMSEAVRFEFNGPNGKERYTADVELLGSDGTRTIVEVKRNQRDLTDPAYRAKLARVREICEENKMRFRIVFRDEIWVNVVHRRNVTLFASRAFTTIRPEHLDRLGNHREMTGPKTSFGELAGAIDPVNRRYGEAVVQALTVARRIEIDLTRPIFDATEVTIH